MLLLHELIALIQETKYSVFFHVFLWQSRSKKDFNPINGIMTTPRLDILIYAHDGRGLGHAARSIAIGMALRRLYPHLKVLFVSGCRQSQELIGTAPFDWLKLPSYETKVKNGKSIGIPGKTLFSDDQLGAFRAREIEHLVGMYRPRIVLVDHTPQGKHKELIPALTLSQNIGTRWILGVRGVVGAVSQARSELAGNLFRKYYHGLLWYGDKDVLGNTHIDQLSQQYGVLARECGYVARLSEVAHWMDGKFAGSSGGERLAGTVSVPWMGEKSLGFLEQLGIALADIPQDYGDWHLFVDLGDSIENKKYVQDIFSGIDYCRLEQPGPKYTEALLRSKTAVIYGGYNSLMDVLYAGIPALVVEREMRDGEQQLHLQRLREKVGEGVRVIPEAEIPGEQIASCLLENLLINGNPAAAVNLDGAANVAVMLNRLLNSDVR
jgi:predicted glycosyltransferase